MRKRRKIAFIIFIGLLLVMNILYSSNVLLTKTPLLNLMSVNNQGELSTIINNMGLHLSNIAYLVEDKVYIYKGLYKDNELTFNVAENFTNSIEIKYNEKNSKIKCELFKIILTGKVKYFTKNYIWIFINNNSISFQFKEDSVFIIIDYKFEIMDLINNDNK